LLRGLVSTGSESYREVAHRILAFYSTTYPGTTPEFEGALDSPIGAPAAPLIAPDAWPAQNTGNEFHIDAGTLNGVTVGSVLALDAALPAQRQPAAIGVLRVTRTALTEAWATPLSDRADLARWHVTHDLTADTGAGVARPLELKRDEAVRIAMPAACLPALHPCAASASDRGSAALDLAMRLVHQPEVLPQAAALTDDPASADLLLIVAQRRLLIVRPGIKQAVLTGSLGIDLDAPDAKSRLREALQRAVRAQALVRLAAEYPGSAQGLEATLRARDGAGRWHALDARRIDGVPMASQLAIRLQNRAAFDMDVTVLAIDEQFGITAVYPIDQETNRLSRGSAPVEVPGYANAPGEFELLFITEQAQPGQPHDLSYLAQPGTQRGHSAGGFPQLLEQLGYRQQITRSMTRQGGEAAIQVVRYEVLERQ
jgi:hypothetical protein